MIRKATEKDVPAIEQTYIELLTHEKNGVSHSNWRLGLYPTGETAARAVERGDIFVLEDQGEIAASVILNQEQAPCYNEIPWRFEAAPTEVLVVHTLCVPPSKGGKGFATQMIAFAKALAVETDCRVIRMDTFAQNEPAKTLYLKNGFRIAGYADAMLEGVIPEELVMLEYLL